MAMYCLRNPTKERVMNLKADLTDQPKPESARTKRRREQAMQRKQEAEPTNP